MNSLLVGITTSPRPERYLIRTIASIKAAATATEPRFLISPNFIDADEDWDAVRAAIGPKGRVLAPLINQTLDGYIRSTPALAGYRDGDPHASERGHRGIELNSDRLLVELVAGDDSFFLACQDDLVMCPRALDRIHDVGKHVFSRGAHRTGAVSFYSPMIWCGKCPKTLWRYPGIAFYGELAILWSAAAARDFLPFSNHNEAHDLEIGRFFSTMEHRWLLWGHSPCLVQHVGTASARAAVTAGMRRESMNFRADYDALKDPKPWP